MSSEQPPVFRFLDISGQPLDHRFELEADLEKVNIQIYSSGGGNKVTGMKYNGDYNLGVMRLLDRLRELSINIQLIYVNSEFTKKNLTIEQSTLEFDYPQNLHHIDSNEMRLEMGRKMKVIGSKSKDPTKGNSQKRLSIIIPNVFSTTNLFEIATELSGEFCRYGKRRKYELGYDLDGESLHTKSNKKEGWIYMLQSPVWRNWVKIGFTRDLSSRYYLYNQNVPVESDHYDFIQTFHHENASIIEERILNDEYMQDYLGSKKSWFKIDENKAAIIINNQIQLFDSLQ